MKVEFGGAGARALKAIAANRDKTLQRFNAIIENQFSRFGPLVAGHIVRTQLSGKPGPTFSRPGSANKQVKKRRTGGLARAVSAQSVKINGVPQLQIGLLKGPTDDYGVLQELGTRRYNPASPIGTVKAKNGGALAVPIDKTTKTAAGVSRYSSARDYPKPLAAIYFRRPGGRNRNVIGKLVLEQQYRDAVNKAVARSDRPSIFDLKAVYLLLSHMDVRPGFFLQDGTQDYLPTMADFLVEALLKDFFA